ncbi:MAG TPA: HDOD domain-containing protein [Noviherbaspirillum sp.]|uniref:HDOD domain-containing protein n=1 Tax=Noviherbaspirillum sp. TaxID=1926288 RepID=UPI002DDD9384|nr:HDOD domain-containing protein [Noviherbaspirillum sp.]HEV2610636.1 HDOD domain-containing protein [Noviherbaspirillum sp.]
MVFQPAGPSKIDGASPALSSDDATGARDRLLQKISAESDLPSLGSSISRVVEMASSGDEAVRNLAHFILSDVALTQKILRIANTVVYHAATGTPVTTVSRAIFLLGFDTVKTCALAMLLVDGMSGKHGRSVRIELCHALTASILGRELARRSHFKDAEEAAIAALFKNIGRLLVASHDHDSYSEIAALTEGGKVSPVQAAMKVIGCSLDALTDAVLQEWQMPDTIINALAPLPSGALKPAKSRQEWMQQVAAFSSTAATVIPHVSETGQHAASAALLNRFGAAFNLDQEKLNELFMSVARESRVLISNTGLAMDGIVPDPLVDELDGESAERGLPDELLLAGSDGSLPQVTERHQSGKPVNARDLLLAGMQDVTQMMASGQCKVNDLMLLVLETLYGSMGFRFATVCLRDVQSGTYRARISIGQNNAVRQAGFSFPATDRNDLFCLALEKGADLMISDAAVPKIRSLLPAWHRTLLPDARSFIVLPLVVNRKPIGLFYADRTLPAPEGVPADETALIKTLKAQIIGALQTRS